MKAKKQTYRFEVYLRFWKRPSLPGYLMDRGGSFNLKLYLLYLDQIRNEQPTKI
jgi:hypothetical protein